MFSPYDAGLVRGDPELPGLATLLDPEAFVALVRRAAPDSAVRSARIGYVKYKPGVNCLVGYQLDLDEALRDGYARALRRRDYARHAATTGGQHTLACDEQAIQVMLFPRDRRLVGLRQLAVEL